MEEDVLKMRLMGTKRDMIWLQKILKRNKMINMVSISDKYTIKGSNRYYRMYVEIDRNDRKYA